jgi:predicted TIM-barrel fold metal-dependent hydrolase
VVSGGIGDHGRYAGELKRMNIDPNESGIGFESNRRDFLRLGAKALGATVAGGSLIGSRNGHRSHWATGAESALEIIDCHTHFYDPSRPQGVPWPPKDSSLYRTVLPKDLRNLEMHRPITGTVIVEASEWIEDNQWLLELAQADPFIVGIVGRLDPTSGVFAEQLERFAANELYRGIRIWEDRAKSLLDRNELEPFERMARRGISADLNGGPETVWVVDSLAKRVPDLTIVLNHIGNVAITSESPPEAWKVAIRAAAKHPNVYCKISALVEGAARDSKKAPEDLEFYRPTLDVVWDAFGEDRVIYGSNWPVCELAADYKTVQRLSMDYARQRGQGALEKFCATNSSKAYRWISGR